MNNIAGLTTIGAQIGPHAVKQLRGIHQGLMDPNIAFQRPHVLPKTFKREALNPPPLEPRAIAFRHNAALIREISKKLSFDDLDPAKGPKLVFFGVIFVEVLNGPRVIHDDAARHARIVYSDEPKGRQGARRLVVREQRRQVSQEEDVSILNDDGAIWAWPKSVLQTTARTEERLLTVHGQGDANVEILAQQLLELLRKMPQVYVNPRDAHVA